MTTIAKLVSRSNRYRWELPSEFRAELLAGAELKLADWLRGGAARIVKHGPHRTVYHVTLPRLDFYVKHNRLPDARSWLRQWFRPAKARIEYDRALAIHGRGIATAVPLGIGECNRTGPGESFLLTYALADAQPFSTFVDAVLPTLPPRREARMRRELALALARLVARMHDEGVTHHDLHAGNILVRCTDNGEPELFVIDLHAVSLGQALTWTQARANLIALNRWFIMRSDRSDRLRFWEEYYCLRGGKLLARRRTPSSYRQLACDLERATWHSNLRFWERRDGRCLRANRYYQTVRAASLAGYAVRDLDLDEDSPLLRDPDAVYRDPAAKLLKDSASSTVAELDVPVAGSLRRVILKRFRVNRWFEPLLSLVRRTAALRSWIHGQGLRERGLPTPRTLLIVQQRKLGMFRDGYLLTEKIPDAVDLRTFIERLEALPAAERRALLRGHIEQIACLVRELHRRGLSHRDLKAANILLSPEPCPWSLLSRARPPLRHQPWLIDLCGVTRHAQLPYHRRVQNLARLNASFSSHRLLTRSDKLRFLRTYLQWGLLGRHDWKKWWLAVEAATRAKLEKNARSGRPLA